MPVLFLLEVQKWGFRPAGATRCPDKREIWHGGADRMSAHPRQISRLWVQNCGNTAPKTVKKFDFWPEICTSRATRLQYFYEIRSICTRLVFGHFRGTNTHVISIFLRWGHFPTNFQWPLAAKLLIASKKVGGAKIKRTSSITMRSMVVILGRAPAVDEKV